MRLFNNFFKRSKVKHVTFYFGTEGMKEHTRFIDEINEKNIKIINSFVTYHKYSSAHVPEYLNYVIKTKH